MAYEMPPNDTMQNNPFPATRQDIENLKQTAVEAAKDIGNTASVHAEKAKDQLGDLAGHAKEETVDQLHQTAGSLINVVASARDYVSERPFASMGIALGLGVFFGFMCRRHSEA
jgi:ElaB/YqjD/DUF883 family membrane-anchored ribosome-binding protein